MALWECQKEIENKKNELQKPKNNHPLYQSLPTLTGGINTSISVSRRQVHATKQLTCLKTTTLTRASQKDRLFIEDLSDNQSFLGP